MECWFHDEDVQLIQSEQLELEGHLEVSVEEIPVVDEEAVRTDTNTFCVFLMCFHLYAKIAECPNISVIVAGKR